MKAFVLLFFLPIAAFAQQEVSCSKSSILYSRELFPNPVTIERAIALSGYDDQCTQLRNESATKLSAIKVSEARKYQFYPVDYIQQDLFGREMPMGVLTDQLVNHLVFDRN